MLDGESGVGRCAAKDGWLTEEEIKVVEEKYILLRAINLRDVLCKNAIFAP